MSSIVKKLVYYNLFLT